MDWIQDQLLHSLTMCGTRGCPLSNSCCGDNGTMERLLCISQGAGRGKKNKSLKKIACLLYDCMLPQTPVNEIFPNLNSPHGGAPHNMRGQSAVCCSRHICHADLASGHSCWFACKDQIKMKQMQNQMTQA